MKLHRLVIIAVLGALLAGCTNFNPQDQPKQTAGAVLGAIGGGLLGAQVERDCRDFEQTVVVDGQDETVRGTACREPDGTWRAL
jgi:surface antigen